MLLGGLRAMFSENEILLSGLGGAFLHGLGRKPTGSFGLRILH